ncbi:MAG: NAD-dependent epimerase/dehydratase family protein [candidate division FCPU426 bacterium]
MSNFWQGKRVLVTGATGLLGSWLTEELAAQKAEVVVLIRDHVPRSRFYLAGLDQRVTAVRGPLEDYALIERTLNEYETQVVFHLAAQTIVGTANRSPLATFEANIRGTWNLLEAVRTSPLKPKLLVASSDKAYGDQPQLPYTEDVPLAGRHPYDVSKTCADLLAQAYVQTYRLPLAIARCGNLFGGGDLNFNRLIPGTIRSFLAGERPIIRSDGSPKRDYFFVRDAASAYLLLAENLDRPEVQGQAFNFGTNEPLTPLQIIEELRRLMNVQLQPEIQNTWQGEIHHQYLDSSKAKRVLGWKPAYTLEQGLKETIAWYRDFLKGK